MRERRPAMPNKDRNRFEVRARAYFEARAIAYGLDIAKFGNGDDYDSDETQCYWLGFCWALGLA